jgi:hypothetical protein
MVADNNLGGRKISDYIWETPENVITLWAEIKQTTKF